METNPILNSMTFIKKRIKTLFTAQASKPARLAEIKLSRLTPFQRALLVTDGTVTRFIEAYTFSPVEVVLLHQAQETLCAEHVWLELPTDTQILNRQVVLQTPATNSHAPRIHAYAASQIVTERLPKSILAGLESGIEGVGMLLKKSMIETRRNLLWWGVEHDVDLPKSIQHLETEPLLSRTYNVIAEGLPIMLITEKFPLDEPVPV